MALISLKNKQGHDIWTLTTTCVTVYYTGKREGRNYFQTLPSCVWMKCRVRRSARSSLSFVWVTLLFWRARPVNTAGWRGSENNQEHWMWTLSWGVSNTHVWWRYEQQCWTLWHWTRLVLTGTLCFASARFEHVPVVACGSSPGCWREGEDDVS